MHSGRGNRYDLEQQSFVERVLLFGRRKCAEGIVRCGISLCGGRKRDVIQTDTIPFLRSTGCSAALFQIVQDRKRVRERAEELACQKPPQTGFDAVDRDKEKNKSKADAKRRGVDHKRAAGVPETMQDARHGC